MDNYSTKLKDPRWQKKRLEILQRDNWTCRKCGDTKSTLVVHHKDYLPKTEPWDYPNDLLTTVCEDCHLSEMDNAPIENMIVCFLRKNFWSDDLCSICYGLSKLPNMESADTWILSELLYTIFSNPTLRNKLTSDLFASMKVR